MSTDATLAQAHDLATKVSLLFRKRAEFAQQQYKERLAKASADNGIGELLTTERIRWTAERSDAVYYFANLANGPILDLHQSFGFTEVTRDFTFPRAPLKPGTGVLLRAELS